MTPATPQQIIEAFDEILDYTWGRSRGRDWPHNDDEKTAAAWIAQGLTLPIACIVFHNRMRAMHEAWLRRPPNDREAIPHSLKFCAEHIDAAINHARRGGEISVWEQVEAQWRSRVRFWLKGSLWYDNLWGPAPYQPGCRAPIAILKDLLPAVPPAGIGKVKNAG